MTAFFRALGDVLSPELRSVLWRALGLTLLLFIAVLVGVQMLLAVLTEFSWPWADVVLGLGTGLVLLVAFFFLMAPVTAAFAGLFLDHVAVKVEQIHYAADRPGKPLPALQAILTGFRFLIVVLVVNLAVLPTVLFGIGAAVLLLANAYLLSREYFEMAAMRHMPVEDARSLRKANAVRVTLSGFIPAAFALVPVANVLVPLFATSYFTHIFKQAQRSSG